MVSCSSPGHGKEEEVQKKKVRVLCLHGFRTSASIFETQVRRWDPSVLDLLDMTFLDGPLPNEGKSEAEGIFPPPYYEWFHHYKEFTEYHKLEECIAFISDFMDKHGPFDGLMGFSQGAVLSAALAGLQQKGLALKNHPPLRFVLIISGAMFRTEPWITDCYSEKIKCPSLHTMGSNDWLRHANEEAVKIFENPVIVRHGAKHTVPRLSEDMIVEFRKFFLNILEAPEKHYEKVLTSIEEDTSKEPLVVDA